MYDPHHFAEVIEKAVQTGRMKDIPFHMLYYIWIRLLHYYLQNKTLFAPETSVSDRCKDDLVRTFISLTRTYNLDLKGRLSMETA